MPFTQRGIREGKAWRVQETDHYLIFFDDEACKAVDHTIFCRHAERRLKGIAAILGVQRDKDTALYPLGTKILYFVHGDGACKWGNVDLGGIDAMTGARAWFYRHEECHAVCQVLYGPLTPLLYEGLATYVESPGSRRNHRVSLAGIDSNTLPALSSIVDDASFWREWAIHSPFMYCQAGSFVAYLFARFGRERFVSLIRGLSHSEGRRAFLRCFEGVYGAPIDAVEEQWKTYLMRQRKSLRPRSRAVRGHKTETRWIKDSIELIHDNIKKEGQPTPTHPLT